MKDKTINTVEYCYNRQLDKPIRIVQLSDLHKSSFGEGNELLLSRIAELTPDLILITGDMINKRDPEVKEGIAFMYDLAMLAPCFYSLGNHEISFRKEFPAAYDKFIAELSFAGICILDDETVSLSINETELEIGGFTAGDKAYRKFRRTFVFDDCIKPDTKEGLRILLSHNPLLTKTYEKTDWDLIFSGHLHGGIIRLPLLGGVIAPNFKLFPKYSGGIYNLNNKNTLVVSRGLGSHSGVIRLWNPPELTVLNIN